MVAMEEVGAAAGRRDGGRGVAAGVAAMTVERAGAAPVEEAGGALGSGFLDWWGGLLAGAEEAGFVLGWWRCCRCGGDGLFLGSEERHGDCCSVWWGLEWVKGCQGEVDM